MNTLFNRGTKLTSVHYTENIESTQHASRWIEL